MLAETMIGEKRGMGSTRGMEKIGLTWSYMKGEGRLSIESSLGRL